MITVNKRSNQVLNAIAEIDFALLQECGGLSLDDDADRAKLAWWIHNVFCTGGDYREKLKPDDAKLPRRGPSSPDLRGGETNLSPDA